MDPFTESMYLILNENINDRLLHASIQWNIMTDDGKNQDDTALYSVLFNNHLDGVIPFYEVNKIGNGFELKALKDALETWLYMQN